MSQLNQKTKDVLTLPAKLTDSVFASLKDGNFNALTDFGNFIDDISAIKPAIDGAKGLKDENAIMSIDARKELGPAIEAQMPNVPADDRYDIADAMTGILSAIRIGWRKGAKAERAKLREELKSGSLSVEDFIAQSE